MTCQCDICKRSRHVRRELAGGSKRRLRDLVEKLYNQLEGAEMELNYSQAILDGSWPTAVETLEQSLARARERRHELDAREPI